jgi:hypothetical protein
MQLSLSSSTIGQTSLGAGLHLHIFINGGEVCGRYADDARLIRASVNAPTSVVGLPFQTPQACDHLDLWATFCLHFDTKPCYFGTT